VTEEKGAGAPRPRRLADRLLGEAAARPAPKPKPEPQPDRPETPQSVRWAAVVVGVEAVAIAVGGLVLLYLTITGTPDSVPRAIAEVVIVLGGAAVLGLAARGLWRVAAWARGPVIVLQILLGLLALTTVFQAERPLIGGPVLVLVAAVLYLLATPEARLAFFERR
jgi:hypothetical protein